MFLKQIILIFLLFFSKQLFSQGFLKANGKMIVNEKGEEIIFRGMGLGGWMLQEPYMLSLSGVASAQYYRVSKQAYFSERNLHVPNKFFEV